MSVNHTDIQENDWIERQLAPWLRPYARLVRLDRPIGTWLLLVPCWWGLALARGGLAELWPALAFALGAVVMRGAGCVVNDMADRKLDKLVERTRTRPLARGDVTLVQAGVFLALLLVIGLLVLLSFNRLTVALGIASMPLVMLYPFAKRVTWWPQLVLGLAFNWGALLGWSAASGSLDWPALVLYAGGIFWTLGYDTIYAHQDKRDDSVVGVKSLALKLGQRSKRWIAGFYSGALALVALAGLGAGLGFDTIFWLAPAAAHAFWIVAAWKPDDPADCLRRFRANRDFGFLVLAALMFGRWA